MSHSFCISPDILVILSLSHSTVFTILFDIALVFFSSDISFPVWFVTRLMPQSKQPMAIGIIITLYPGRLSLISNVSFWYFYSFSACFASTLFSLGQATSIRNILFLFLYSCLYSFYTLFLFFIFLLWYLFNVGDIRSLSVHSAYVTFIILNDCSLVPAFFLQFCIFSQQSFLYL